MNPTISPERIAIKDMPAHGQLMALNELAKLFLRQGGLVDARDLASVGFSDPQELIEMGWIEKTPGRWSSTYMPGEEVQEQRDAIRIFEEMEGV